jgi:hypothetical protein
MDPTLRFPPRTFIADQLRQLQNPVSTVELLLQEAGLGAAIAGKMWVLEARIGRPQCMPRNVPDCCNGGITLSPATGETHDSAAVITYEPCNSSENSGQGQLAQFRVDPGGAFCKRLESTKKPQLTACHFDEYCMNTGFSAFDHVHHLGGAATYPLARLVVRLPLYPQGVGRIRKAAKAATTPLSRLVAGPGLPPRCFAAATRPNAPAGAFNCGF